MARYDAIWPPPERSCSRCTTATEHDTLLVTDDAKSGLTTAREPLLVLESQHVLLRNREVEEAVARGFLEERDVRPVLRGEEPCPYSWVCPRSILPPFVTERSAIDFDERLAPCNVCQRDGRYDKPRVKDPRFSVAVLEMQEGHASRSWDVFGRSATWEQSVLSQAQPKLALSRPFIAYLTSCRARLTTMPLVSLR